MPPPRISIELVPRSRSKFAAQLEEIRRHFPPDDTINVPVVLRFSMRSWQGCAAARPLFAHTIPHVRAMDIDLSRPLEIAPFLKEHGIGEVLVVTGDAPVDMSHEIFGSSSVEVIRKFRRELPDVKVYAAFDPYRQSFVEELGYAERKLDAGAAGLFTQPLFDLRLLDIYHELLAGVEVFWGVTSVLSERSAGYWHTRNRAVFPADFAPTAAWNRRLALGVLERIAATGGNVYFMPIRAGVREYLEGIL
jgi:methylenetetrahydrofolate reductase (NADPH)